MRRGVVLGSSVFFFFALDRLELKNRALKKRKRLSSSAPWMRIFRLRYALSLLAAVLALLAGGGLDWALEWTHDRLLALGKGDAAAAGGVGPRPRPVDAVVVLGYVLARDGTPSAALEHRVRSAVREWERASRESEEGEEREGGGGTRAKLVFSGGHPGSGQRGPRSEAAAMAGLASELLMLPSRPPPLLGGRKADWILEEASTSTWENAVESLELLSRAFVLSSSSSEGGGGGEEVEGKEREEEGLREKRRRVLSVSIATSPFHQRRALATFRCAAARRREREEEGGAARKRGLRAAAPVAFSFSVAASPRPPPRGPPERFERALEAAREVAAICWYWARGKLCGGG